MAHGHGRGTYGVKLSLVYPPPSALDGGSVRDLSSSGSVSKRQKGFTVPGWADSPSATFGERVRLCVYKSGSVVDTFGIDKRAFYIMGRSRKKTHIHCQHASISNVHCAIIHDGKEGIFIVDCKSTHGTEVNGEKLEAHEPRNLCNGDKIKIGASSRTYELLIMQKNSGESSTRQLPQVPQFGQQRQSGSQIEAETLEFHRKRRRKEREDEIAKHTAIFLGPSLPPELVSERRIAGSLVARDEVRSHQHNDKGGADAETVNLSKPNSSLEKIDNVVEELQLPVNHEFYFKSHPKVVSCLDLDRAGARMISGSKDGNVKIFDLHGMNARGHPFRELEPEDSHSLHALSYSPSGDMFLAVTASSTPKIFDRDGLSIVQFRKGDPYLHDMNRTVGHVSTVTSGQWHPTNRDVVLTSSTDGTMRTWNIHGKRHFDQLMNWQILKCTTRRGVRNGVSCCRYSCDAKMIVGGCQDGSLQIFNAKNTKYHKPDFIVRDAHNGGEVTGICFEAQGGNMMATRGTDETLKMWDIRRISKPLNCWSGLDCVHSTANCVFSPDSLLLLVGTSVNPQGKDKGMLHFFDVSCHSTKPKYTISAGQGESVVYLRWHSRINQIFYGTSAGRIRGLYDPRFSKKGLLNCASKKSSTTGYYTNAKPTVFNPHALPMYEDLPPGKRHRSNMPTVKNNYKPFKPMTGPNRPDYVPKAYNYTQMVVAQRKDDKYLDKDPRAELLKYSDNKYGPGEYVDAAYAKTQPEKKFMEKSLEQEAEDVKRELRGEDKAFL